MPTTHGNIFHGFRTTPQQLEAVSLEWGLDKVRRISASSRSEIFVCRRDDGSPAIVKFVADGAQLQLEACALRAWQDVPVVVDLLGSLPKVGAMLLPYLSSAHSHRAEESDLVLVLRGLTTAEVPLLGFPPLVERVREAFYSTRARLTSLVGESRKGFDEALAASQDRAIRLALEPGAYGLVHSDLHLANVLTRSVFGRPSPVVIDPMPHVGDRTFDAIDVALDRVTSREQLEHRVLKLGSEVRRLDAARLLAWCLACGPVIGLSSIRDNPGDPAAEFLVSLAFEQL